ncbi:transposase [Sphingomonas sanguinis]|nr:transposase [Sphingomonas sanguinis]
MLTRATTPTGCAAHSATLEPFPSCRGDAPGNEPSDTAGTRYRGRHLIENAFCHLKDFRRVATRYDRLAINFLSSVAIATAFAFWL